MSGATGAGGSQTARPRRFADLRVRLASALVLGPLALAAIWFGSPWFAVLVGAASAILAWEWVHLCGLRLRALPGAAVGASLLAASVCAGVHLWQGALVALVLGTVLAWLLVERVALTAAQHRDAVWLAAGVVYIGAAAVGLVWLRADGAAGRANVLFVVLVVWASDIGAYLAGRLLGGPRLAPRISPNKTWAGAAGGLVSALLVGLAVAWILVGLGSPVAAGAVALAVGAAAQAGDLFESWIKRRFMVKDSSRLIPGHGGLLDRADGLLAAAPVAAALSLATGEGKVLWLT
ncbi:MAG: phosphatidate cytidylyltransferase [Elioraea sp.]|nr:phosphatidate cytidylyltransferase [Elioraea sp.]